VAQTPQSTSCLRYFEENEPSIRESINLRVKENIEEHHLTPEEQIKKTIEITLAEMNKVK